MATKIPQAKSMPEETFAQHLKVANIPFERQFYPPPEKRWPWDFAIGDEWMRDRILIEIQGGSWSGGAHVRGKGFQRDCEKFNAATRAGYRCLKFTTEDVVSGKALEFVEWMIE